MGFRFRKSINLGGGFKVNLSKSGVGYSWGTKGVRFTKTAKGASRSTISIPGTGISYVSESKSHSKKVPDSPSSQIPNTPKKGGPHMKKKTWLWILTGFFGLGAFGMLPHLVFIPLLLAAVLVAPIEPLQNYIKRYIKGPVKVIAVIALFLVSGFLMPKSETPLDVPDKGGPASSAIEDMSSASEGSSSADTSKEVIIPPASGSDDSSVDEEQKPADSSATKPKEETPSTSEKKPDAKPKPTPEQKPSENKPAPEKTTSKPVPDSKPSDSETHDYVLNTSTMKFHTPSCSSVDKINPENRGDFHGTRDDLMKKGYEPCGRCHP